ncbi:MAG TPA: LacI family DNA-binding transcriptional regulator [Terracidiphilus sp.]|jgi:LacI family transcriptional regulator|nr:LacI family DNA-binding transcriptional regulator [Terracidiphilus sp.]
MNIREIAKRARVSHSTVSRVINQIDTVDPRLARRVQAVIQEVGYRPNYQARALARGRSHTVGLIVSELSGGNPFFSEIILYFERAAVEQGYEVLVSFADKEMHADPVAVCASRMQERQVEGIATLTFGMEEQLAKFPISVPMVYAGADHDLDGVRNVRINYLPGFRDAIKHLAEFGHQRIGYLSGQLTWSSMRTRYEGLRKAMKLSGLNFDKDLVAECDHTWDGGAQGMATLLNLPKPPTALLCCNDVAAVGALKTLAARGLQAGKDIALIGFDDLTICRFTQPALTTIQFSPREIAGLAFRALLEEIEVSSEKSNLEYKTRFVLRESTCAPRA